MQAADRRHLTPRSRAVFPETPHDRCAWLGSRKLRRGGWSCGTDIRRLLSYSAVSLLPQHNSRRNIMTRGDTSRILRDSQRRLAGAAPARATFLVAAALLASCSGDVVGPRSHTDQPLQVEIAPASAQAEITVTRTSFSPSGDSSIVRRDFRLSIDAIEHAVPVRFSDGRSGGIEAPVFLSSLVEGAPAAETLCRNATPWRSEVRTSSISGFASGFGDEPARQHSVSLADGTRFTVTYVWIRLPNRWIATERVIKER